MELQGTTIKEKAEWLFMITENLDDSVNDFHDYCEEHPEIFKPLYEKLQQWGNLLDRDLKHNHEPVAETVYQQAIDELLLVFKPLHRFCFPGETI